LFFCLPAMKPLTIAIIVVAVAVVVAVALGVGLGVGLQNAQDQAVQSAERQVLERRRPAPRTSASPDTLTRVAMNPASIPRPANGLEGLGASDWPPYIEEALTTSTAPGQLAGAVQLALWAAAVRRRAFVPGTVPQLLSDVVAVWQSYALGAEDPGPERWNRLRAGLMRRCKSLEDVAAALAEATPNAAFTARSEADETAHRQRWQAVLAKMTESIHEPWWNAWLASVRGTMAVVVGHVHPGPRALVPAKLSAAPPCTVHVVLALYGMDTQWLERAVPAYKAAGHRVVLHVYCKLATRKEEDAVPAAARAAADEFTFVRLPNVGRETHTFLHHILTTWDAPVGPLDVVLFASDSAHRRFRDRFWKTAPLYANATSRDPVRSLVDFRISRWRSTSAANAAHNPEDALDPSAAETCGGLLSDVFGHAAYAHVARQNTSTIAFNGVMTVLAAVVKGVPRVTYAALYGHMCNASSPESGHYLERLWITMWWTLPLSGLVPAPQLLPPELPAVANPKPVLFIPGPPPESEDDIWPDGPARRANVSLLQSWWRATTGGHTSTYWSICFPLVHLRQRGGVLVHPWWHAVADLAAAVADMGADRRASLARQLADIASPLGWRTDGRTTCVVTLRPTRATTEDGPTTAAPTPAEGGGAAAAVTAAVAAAVAAAAVSHLGQVGQPWPHADDRARQTLQPSDTRGEACWAITSAPCQAPIVTALQAAYTHWQKGAETAQAHERGWRDLAQDPILNSTLLWPLGAPGPETGLLTDGSLHLSHGGHTGSGLAAAEAQPLPRVVWLYWGQGWDKAPQLQQRVLETWIHHNPSWTVVPLDDATVGRYVVHPRDQGMRFDDAHRAALSDMIRLRLMHEHGGVWADATLPCWVPLDTWVHSASRVWMYHGRASGHGPASWFLVAHPGSAIFTKWRAAADAYWGARFKQPDPFAGFVYAWMDMLFGQLASTDDAFRSEWLAVEPYRDCNNPQGEAHTLQTRNKPSLTEFPAADAPETHPLLAAIIRARPFVVKLTMRPGDTFAPGCLADCVLKASMRDAYADGPPQPVSRPRPSPAGPPWSTSCFFP
jgi:hypothetical protein